MMTNKKPKSPLPITLSPKTIGFWLILGLIVYGLFEIFSIDPDNITRPAFIDFFIDANTHPVIFFLLFAFLPLVGFPISAFCLIVGAKFGFVGGITAMGLAMATHLLISFWLSHSYLRRPLKHWLRNKGYRFHEIPQHRQVAYGIGFVAVPIIPYAIKNYVLALSNLRLTLYFLIAWTIQMLYSIPFIAVTSSVHDSEPYLFVFALIGFILVYLISHRVAKRFSDSASQAND